MSEVTNLPAITASVWIPAEEDSEATYQLGRVDPGRTDDNEISLEVRTVGNGGDTENVATVYLTDAEATRLAFALGAIVLRV